MADSVSGSCLMESLQGTGDRFVQLGALDLIQTGVHIALKEDVAKAVVGKALLTHTLDAFHRNQTVLAHQILAQLLDKGIDILPQHVRNDLGGEALTLDAGYGQEPAQGGGQPLDAFGDHCFHPRR